MEKFGKIKISFFNFLSTISNAAPRARHINLSEFKTVVFHVIVYFFHRKYENKRILENFRKSPKHKKTRRKRLQIKLQFLNLLKFKI